MPQENDMMTPLLIEGSKQIEVPLTAEEINALRTYASMIRKTNEVMNLTAVTDDEGMAMRHFVDSLTLVRYIREEEERQNGKKLRLIDVGTGAGFPGIPLKIAVPGLDVTLMDSLRKRLNFLDGVITELGLQDIRTLHSRAEDAGSNRRYRETFDIATARAVAALPVLCEYCLPFVKTGGVFLAMKGKSSEELEQAKKAVLTLGGTVEKCDDFTLPGSDARRSVIVIRKIRPTPPRFPRQAGKPSKDPIG